MRKVLFISDIMGTIDSILYNEEDLKNIKIKLTKIKDMHGAEEIIFSLCTSDADINYVKNIIKKLKTEFSDDITIGIHFYGKGITDKNGNYISKLKKSDTYINKPIEIAEYAKNLLEREDIAALYFTDDAPNVLAYCGFIEEVIEYKTDYFFIDPFVRGKRSGEGLCIVLDEHIKNLNSKVKQKLTTR